MNALRTLVHGHSHSHSEADSQPHTHGATDYTLDEPLFGMALRAGIAGLVLAAMVVVFSPENQSLALIMVGISVLLIFPWAFFRFLIWRYGGLRFYVRDRIAAAINWQGNEKVLDVGTGSGILLIGCAKKLTPGSGTAVGIDVWQTHAGGATEADFLRNVRAEGVADCCEIQNMDAKNMRFTDKSFDVVVSSLALHHIGENAAERKQGIQEMLRVLKPGGTIALYDMAPVIGEAVTMMKKEGFTDIVKEGFFFPLIIARKPS